MKYRSQILLYHAVVGGRCAHQMC